ncbi:coenzyme F420-0:L-glutamate ligase [Nocardioides insulae]|uniref:coenzyme F420-0:L-glutamate ligase n=1 Tax=Nocardioides insulae TaxID=394734 RepID=UPI00042496FA|nr:coenzyme F420-0:L-glutamate ligase [Nocardioides insulae]
MSSSDGAEQAETRPGRITLLAPDGVGEVTEGDDLVGLLLDALAGTGERVRDGDIVVVTSKVVAKAEGRVRPATTRDAELAGETIRVVARRGPVSIVRNRLGLTMAAAGIDASNVRAGSVVLLPLDPDGSARALRAELRARTGRQVGVIVSDTAGRAWREGQTDLAIGAAGLQVSEEYAGRVDAHGNELAVTAPAVADELAGAAELASGKLGGRPFTLVRGRADLVLGSGAGDGPGAASLIRPEGGDFFGYGAREAVVRALTGDPGDLAPFGAPAPAADLADALLRVTGVAADRHGAAPGTRGDDVLVVELSANDARVRAVAFAHGWVVEAEGHTASSLRPATP